MWFRVPNQIYFNMNAVENLRSLASSSTIIITNPAIEQMGHVDVVRRHIPPQTLVHVSVIPDAEPEVKTILQGVEALNFYKADQIIALGGGSVIDAAKIMKLKYESPEADLEELAAPFMDIRKRVVEYPTEKVHQARLVALSTTSGTGSEVTPFAVLTDKARGRKVTLADYSLTPAVCHVDAKGPDGRYRHRLLDSCARGRGLDLRFALHRLQRNAGDSAGLQVSADLLRAPSRRRSAQHDAQRSLHCSDRIFERGRGR
jgi:alcohol dehydrogenase class IV